MDNIAVLVTIALVHLLAISSPGPTFVVVTRYAAAGDRRAGFLVALGVCLATLTWASFAATGLSAVITAYPTAYQALQYAGAAYLVWLGAKLIYGFFKEKAAGNGQIATAPAGGWRAVLAGYLTNISNPKVIAYYTSLFGVMVPAGTSPGMFVAVVLTVLGVSALWWIAVALFFSIERVRQGFLSIRRWLDLAMGGLLVAIGIRLALSR
jgi:threonine efflux protein